MILSENALTSAITRQARAPIPQLRITSSGVTVVGLLHLSLAGSVCCIPPITVRPDAVKPRDMDEKPVSLMNPSPSLWD